MEIHSSAFADGKILDRYGGRSGNFIGPVSPVSFPFEIVGSPEGTVSYAVVFDDPDVIPLRGFVWRHWLVSGLTRDSLPENASRTDPTLVQGMTSWYPERIPVKEDSCFYGGPNPPNAPHTYSFRVYALDFVPPLRTGFSFDELMGCIEGHILDEAEIRGTYAPRE